MKKTMILFTLIIALFAAACGYSETEVSEVQEIYVPVVVEPVVEEVVYEPVEEVDGLQLLEEYLGVSFTVNPVEVVWNEYRWQFLELHGELDLNNFPGEFGGSMISVLASDTEKGDVLIVTTPEGSQYLHINQGSPVFYVSEQDVMVELYATESLSWAEIRTQQIEATELERLGREIESQAIAQVEHMETLAEFGMYVQFETEHFIFMSTDKDVGLLEEVKTVIF